MSYNFKGKKVLVTGAASGIGRGIATTLAKSGCKVYAVDINESSLGTLSNEYSDIVPIVLDISNWDETKNVLRKLEAMDGIVNNAGIVCHCPALEVSKGDLDKVLSVNLLAAVNIIQVCAKQMTDQKKHGSIVNVSSTAGEGAVPNIIAYSVSKAGLDMVTKQFALELGPHNIRVNSVRPSLVMTDLAKKVIAEGNPCETITRERTPMSRRLEVDDVVGPVLYLLSDHSAMVTGAQHAVDGGLLCNITTKS